MDISMESIMALVGEAYDRGLNGCEDLKQQEIEELMNKFQITDKQDFRVWKIKELKEIPEGTIFQHMLRGRCLVCCRADGSKFMQFDRGQAMDFNSDDDPWDKPMKIIHKSDGWL